ncbi:MAG: DUF4003 family protein [Clostridiaceae bacterium]
MDENLQKRVDLFLDNNAAMKGSFVWQYAFTKRLSALLYTTEGLNINTFEIENNMKLIKQTTSTFSIFRGNSIMTMATMMALSPNGEELLQRSLLIYEAMKSIGFRVSDYLVIASAIIASNSKEGDYSKVIVRAKNFYDGMKEKHKIITGPDDYIFSVLLALSKVDVNTGVKRIEEIFQELKPDYRIGNAIQSMAQILVVGEEEIAPEEIRNRLYGIRNGLRKYNLKLDREYSMTSLGILSLLPVDSDKVVNEIKEVHAYIREFKGFGNFMVTNQEVLIISAALISFHYLDRLKKDIINGTVSAAMINMIVAAQTAAAAAAAATATAAAQSSNG